MGLYTDTYLCLYYILLFLMFWILSNLIKFILILFYQPCLGLYTDTYLCLCYILILFMFWILSTLIDIDISSILSTLLGSPLAGWCLCSLLVFPQHSLWNSDKNVQKHVNRKKLINSLWSDNNMQKILTGKKLRNSLCSDKNVQKIFW